MHNQTFNEDCRILQCYMSYLLSISWNNKFMLSTKGRFVYEAFYFCLRWISHYKKKGSILCRLNKTRDFRTLQTGKFEGKLNQMAIKEGRKTFLIPGALVLQKLAIQGSRLSTGTANLLENWVCFTKPNIFSCNSYSKKQKYVFIMHWFLMFQHDGNNIQGGKVWNLKCLPGIWGKIMCGASPPWCLFCQMCPSPCSWGGGEQVLDKTCLCLRGKDFLYQHVLLCSESQMLTSALALANEVRVWLLS